MVKLTAGLMTVVPKSHRKVIKVASKRPAAILRAPASGESPCPGQRGYDGGGSKPYTPIAINRQGCRDDAAEETTVVLKLLRATWSDVYVIVGTACLCVRRPRCCKRPRMFHGRKWSIHDFDFGYLEISCIAKFQSCNSILSREILRKPDRQTDSQPLRWEA
ncbi:hypothetical protein J6590_028119 [Homalodisca vitripennis]|nr:hypothetical protein J6590_028119 [Homalodisca vitripennis]